MGNKDRRPVQGLFGHRDVMTRMINAHVLNVEARGVQSPAEALATPGAFTSAEALRSGSRRSVT